MVNRLLALDLEFIVQNNSKVCVLVCGPMKEKEHNKAKERDKEK